MSPQTETKAGVGFKDGVKVYKLNYYTPDYETKDIDILATFRVTPQPGVPPREAGRGRPPESSTSTWTTVWTDRLTSLDHYKGKCYDIEPVTGEDNQYICYVAYPLDLFEECSDLTCLLLTPPHGIQVKRDKLNKAVYECLRGGLDFTKDDENMNSQPFMCWRDRFLFCAEAIYKTQAETGEIKGHYLNATAENWEFLLLCQHDYLTSGFTANTSLAHYCRDNGLVIHIYCAMHAIIDLVK
ncbi:hypothetical protein MKW92_017307 [Papaver armeniacum]|nr:hypothetical protein MKW92_017307 [Papaver armeniacum]